MEEFTGIPEVDFSIMLQLNLRSLKNICRTNRYLNSLCQSDYFWKKKIQQDLGQNIVQMKPFGESYRDQYRYIIITGAETAAADGRMDALIWMERYGDRYIGTETANAAASNGHLNVLQWLSSMGIFPVEDVVEDAPNNIVNWYSIVKAIQTGDSDMFENIIADVSIANLAAHYNRLEILDLLNVLPDQVAADNAMINENEEVLEWLAERGVFPSQVMVNVMAMRGNIAMLDWLEGYGILPNEEGVIEALRAGQRRSLKWLVDRDIPTAESANMMISDRNIMMLLWLKDHGILPDERGVDIALEQNDKHILKFLEENDLL